MPLMVGDLFSGIGGFSLGLERAGMRTAWFCEAWATPWCPRSPTGSAIRSSATKRHATDRALATPARPPTRRHHRRLAGHPLPVAAPAMTRNARGHRRYRSSATATPKLDPKTAQPRMVTQAGIQRHPHRQPPPQRPLTPRHEAVLRLVGPSETASAAAIARTLGLSSDSVTAALYVLPARGLVERQPFHGWIRTI